MSFFAGFMSFRALLPDPTSVCPTVFISAFCPQPVDSIEVARRIVIAAAFRPRLSPFVRSMLSSLRRPPSWQLPLPARSLTQCRGHFDMAKGRGARIDSNEVISYKQITSIEEHPG